MSEIILGLVILALLSYIAWDRRETKKERSKFVNALIAKNSAEMVNLDMTDNTQVKVQDEPLGSEYVDTDDIPDQDYIDSILGKINDGE